MIVGFLPDPGVLVRMILVIAPVLVFVRMNMFVRMAMFAFFMSMFMLVRMFVRMLHIPSRQGQRSIGRGSNQGAAGSGPNRAWSIALTRSFLSGGSRIP